MGSDKPEIEKEYMKVLRPCLHFHGIQIKSLEAFKQFAAAVSTIEESCGVHECTISLEDIFVCPWIDFDLLCNRTEMEKLLIGLIEKITSGENK